MNQPAVNNGEHSDSHVNMAVAIGPGGVTLPVLPDGMLATGLNQHLGELNQELTESERPSLRATSKINSVAMDKTTPLPIEGSLIIIDECRALLEAYRYTFERMEIPTQCYASLDRAEINITPSDFVILERDFPGDVSQWIRDNLISRGVPFGFLTTTPLTGFLGRPLPEDIHGAMSLYLDKGKDALTCDELLEQVRVALESRGATPE